MLVLGPILRWRVHLRNKSGATKSQVLPPAPTRDGAGQINHLDLGDLIRVEIRSARSASNRRGRVGRARGETVKVKLASRAQCFLKS